jgi:hypothetical protein
MPPRGAPAAGSWAQTCQLRAASTLRPAPVASRSVTGSDPSDRVACATLRPTTSGTVVPSAVSSSIAVAAP